MQAVNAVFSWPGAVIIVTVVLLLLAVVFRLPLTGLLNRLIEFRAARTKEGVELAIRGAEEPLAEKLVEEEEKTPEEMREVVKAREAAEALDPGVQALNALSE